MTQEWTWRTQVTPCGTRALITEIIFMQINIYIYIYILTYCLSHLACTLHKIVLTKV